MCNAMNHTGCACGFGPPYPAIIVPLEREEWSALSLEDEQVFKAVLQQIGLTSSMVRSRVARYRAAKHLLRNGRTPLSDRIGELIKIILGNWQLKVVERRRREIHLPLCHFSSPRILGKETKVIYKESSTKLSCDSWSVKIFGVGLGATQTLGVRFTAEFPSSNGCFKTVFIPVTVECAKMALMERGRCKRTWLRVQAVEYEEEGVLKRGLKDTTQEDKKELKTFRKVKVADWDLTEATSDEPAKLDYDESCIGKSSILFEPISAFGFKVSLRMAASRKHELTLTSSLPQEHRYHLFKLQDEKGFTWAVT